jgi:hypothetical protein
MYQVRCNTNILGPYPLLDSYQIYLDFCHNIQVSSDEWGNHDLPFTNLKVLAEFIVHILKPESGLLVSEEYITYLCHKIPSHFMPELDLGTVEISEEDNVVLRDLLVPEQAVVVDEFHAPPLRFGFLECSELSDSEDEEEREEGQEEETYTFEDTLSEDPDELFEYDELVNSFFKKTGQNKFTSRIKQYKRRFRCPRNNNPGEDNDDDDDIQEGNGRRRGVPPNYKRKNDKDGLDELRKILKKSIKEYVIEGRCGKKFNALNKNEETVASREMEVEALIQTMSTEPIILSDESQGLFQVESGRGNEFNDASENQPEIGHASV